MKPSNEILESISAQQGWDDSTKLALLCDFVDGVRHPLNESFQEFLLKRQNEENKAVKSLYKGEEKFTREQLVFFVECSLISVIDSIDHGLPHSAEWEERVECNRPRDPCALSDYETGALESAGMAIAILYADLTGDGISYGDVLECTRVGHSFYEACEKLVYDSWSDEGKAIKDRQKSFEGSYAIKSLYGDLWPDTRKHAEAFVDKVFCYQSVDAYLSPIIPQPVKENWF